VYLYVYAMLFLYMILFCMFVYVIFIHPLREIEKLRQEEYDNKQRIFVQNLLYLQELNRKIVKEELKEELKNGNLFIENVDK
jgi:hypothetical protein